MAVKSLKDQVKKIVKLDKRRLKLQNGKTVARVLEESAVLLRNILYEEILNTYDYKSYWYGENRAFDFADSLHTEDMLKIDPATGTITIGFTEESWHDSWITKQGNRGYDNPGYVPKLINEGFEIFNTGARYKGQKYIEKAIARFELVKPSWVKVVVHGLD